MEKSFLFYLVLLSYMVKVFTQEDFGDLMTLEPFERDKILTCAEFINKKFQLDGVR
jgi:hypothetical protein